MKKIKIVIFIFFIGIFATFSQQKKYITYKVTKGENIQSISKKLSITPYDLMQLNPDLGSNIKENDILIIPNIDYDSSKEIADVDLRTLTERDIVVDNYIYHDVLSKETLYSIQKNYNVTNEELNKLNPFLLTRGLKYGDVLKIPLQIKEEEIAKKDENTQPYLVKPKETKYSIARSFGISIAYFEQLNPKIKEIGLQIDDVVLVPKLKATEDLDYTVHTVEKLETLYSLSNKFEISQEELMVANPELEEGVKEGMLIKIPKKGEENIDVFIDEILEGKKLEVAMMLPFKVKQDTLDFEKNRLLNITTDFYFGALLALDSLKKQGLSIHMKVYDTENSAYVSGKISEKSEFNDFDVIIGPLFLKNIKAVSKNVKYKKPMLVSPISTQDHSGIENYNLIQQVPTKGHLTREILEYIKTIYTDQKLVVILDEEETNNNFKALIRELEVMSNKESIAIIKPDEGYIKSDVFKENIDENKENWFLLLGSDGVIAADVINNLGVLPEEINVTLFALEKSRGYDKIDNNFLARVNFHYPTFNFMDEESLSLKYFNRNFKRKYHYYPTKYAIEGFDITYDILMRLSNETTVLTQQGISQRLATRYNFIENTSNSILNKGIFIVKYEGLTLKVVK